MARKSAPAPAETERVKTSLMVGRDVYDRAHQYKLDCRRQGKPKDIWEIFTEALDEYLKKRGA